MIGVEAHESGLSKTSPVVLYRLYKCKRSLGLRAGTSVRTEVDRAYWRSVRQCIRWKSQERLSVYLAVRETGEG